MPVTRKVFQSSLITNAEYNSDTMELEVEFGNGRVYRNQMPVPPKAWSELAASPSPGTYFRTQIMPHWGGYELNKELPADPPVPQENT